MGGAHRSSEMKFLLNHGSKKRTYMYKNANNAIINEACKIRHTSHTSKTGKTTLYYGSRVQWLLQSLLSGTTR